MTDKYCSRGEIKKLEAEMWNLKVKESDKIEKYVGGLPDMIYRNSENKRKQDDNQQQQQNKRQNTGRAYAVGSGEKKPYGGSKPLSTANANTPNNQRGTRAGQKPTCYECGAKGHFKRDCPKLKNDNRGNQGGNGNAPVKVFVSTAFSSQIDITPSTLDHYYDVELADGRIIGLNAIIQEIIRIPWGNETLIVRGDGSDWGNETRLNIILCTKTQKYMLKGCPIFLAYVTTKETEDKSKKKRLEDVPLV
ncbi:putative reverse transcriptase domain-containing protein [Tanacetum coccineum]